MWGISCVCEEYGCLPLQAKWEIDNDPEFMALRILPLRSFARSHRAFKDAIRNKTLKDLPRDYWMKKVMLIDRKCAKEDIVRWKEEAERD